MAPLPFPDLKTKYFLHIIFAVNKSGWHSNSNQSDLCVGPPAPRGRPALLAPNQLHIHQCEESSKLDVSTHDARLNEFRGHLSAKSFCPFLAFPIPPTQVQRPGKYHPLSPPRHLFLGRGGGLFWELLIGLAKRSKIQVCKTPN